MGLKDTDASREYSRAYYQAKKIDPVFMEKQRIKARESYVRNREKIRVRAAEYRKRNADKIKEARSKYNASMSEEKRKAVRSVEKAYQQTEKSKSQRKTYRSNNAEKLRVYHAGWRKSNPDRYIESIKRCYRVSRDNANKTYIAGMLKIPVAKLPDEYADAHSALLQLKRLLREMRNENAK